MNLIGRLPYTVFPGGIRRPIVNVALINSHNPSLIYFNLPCILDTGADNCLLPPFVGNILGHNLLTGTSLLVSGVCGPPSTGYLHSNNIIVLGQVINCGCYICPDFNIGMGLLGQNGFFSQFSVYFNYKMNYFEIYK